MNGFAALGSFRRFPPFGRVGTAIRVVVTKGPAIPDRDRDGERSSAGFDDIFGMA